MVNRYLLSAMDHVIHSLSRFNLTLLADLFRLANSYRLCSLIRSLCLSASIVARNFAALLIPISDGVELILLNSWAQWIVAFRIFFRSKPNLVFPASTVLSENPLNGLQYLRPLEWGFHNNSWTHLLRWWSIVLIRQIRSISISI